ncbi:MAG: hypothetical protein J7559_08265, partial [Cohnella sp.]|nr:hypothetical protein [Cohnella sp.]
YKGSLPYMLGDYDMPAIPLYRCISINSPGCFWGKSVIERCIPIQRRYNAVRNRRAEYLNLVAIGQWYEPEGSLTDDSELNNTPSNIIRYRAINGEKPMPVQFPGLPADFSREEQLLTAEFTSVSGVSELSRFSEAPNGVKSGVALGMVTDQDDTRLATTASNIGNCFVNVGQAWIRLYRQFVQEPRMLRTIGLSEEVEVREWYASDLRSDDVILENSSALAETPSQRRQMVFDLVGTGVFNRPETNPFSEEGKQKLFQLLEFGHWEYGAEDMGSLQKSRARRENMQIVSGKLMQVPPIMDFDDDTIHIEQHDRMRMSAEYDALMKTPIGPFINQIMVAHKDMHAQRLAQVQRQQQMQAILAQAKALPMQKQTPSAKTAQ